MAEKLEQELERTLGGRIPRFEDLVSLPYTRMLIEEALRLYPPTWILARSPLADDAIGGYRIHRKSVLLISPYLIHRHPESWGSPEAFDPERFRRERSESRARYAYLPFGGGPRVCLGKAWALMEMQLIVATVAQKYRLRPGRGCLVAAEAGIVLRPKGRLLMESEARLLWNDVQAWSGSPLQGIARRMITRELLGLMELPIRLEVTT